VQELLEQGAQLVVADRDLLEPTLRVPDDVHVLAGHDLAGLGDEPVPPEHLARRHAVRAGGDGDQGVVQVRVGEEQRRRVQPVRDHRRRPLVDVELAVELHDGRRRLVGVAQHVVVGQQQAGPDEEAGPARHQPAAGAHRDAPGRARRTGAAREEVHRLQVVVVQHPLQQHVRGEDGAGDVGRRQRPRRQLAAAQQPRGPGLDLLRRPDDAGALGPAAGVQLVAQPRRRAVPIPGGLRRPHLSLDVHAIPPGREVEPRRGAADTA